MLTFQFKLQRNGASAELCSACCSSPIQLVGIFFFFLSSSFGDSSTSSVVICELPNELFGSSSVQVNRYNCKVYLSFLSVKAGAVMIFE